MKKTLAMIVAAFSSLAGCVVEDRVVVHDWHPPPGHYARPHYAPAPFHWMAPRHRGHRHHHHHGHRAWGRFHHRW